MTRVATPAAIVLGVAMLAPPGRPAEPRAAVTARNPIDLARPAETLVLSAADLSRVLRVDDIRTVHVTDGAGGPEILAQAVDLDDDGKFDQLVFQADFASRESRTFGLAVGERHVYTRDQFKAYGRFVRERRDDFAWENDRIARRMYGAALETWAQEPLTSSTVDVWFKRTRRLIVNEWYMVDDYHRDNGDGADMYSAGRSRGCGGNGIWDGGKLYTSANFIESRSIANGPIRVMFELTYPAFDAAGAKVTEVKRVTLDAGQNLDRFESRYIAAPALPKVQAAGIKRHPDAIVFRDKLRGLLRTWEPVKQDGSHFGCGILVDPSSVVDFAEADGNVLVATKIAPGGMATYWAGFGWDKSGDFATDGDWDRYLDLAAQRIRSPLAVSVSTK